MRTISTYRSYNFVDKDPIIDRVRTMMRQAGLSLAEVERKSGVKESTLDSWFNGKTRKPQFATISAVISACGFELVPQEIARHAPAHATAGAPAKHMHRDFAKAHFIAPRGGHWDQHRDRYAH